MKLFDLFKRWLAPVQRRPPTTGSQAGLAICDALGVPSVNVTHVKLVCGPRGPALIEITRFVSDSEAETIGNIVSK